MKKTIITLITLFALCLSASAKYEKVIPIETKNTSMVLLVAENGEVQFFSYGPKYSNPEQVLAYKSYRRASYSMDAQAYPARGGKLLVKPALAVEYASGEINTELRYVNHTSTTVKDGLQRTIVETADAKTGLQVNLVYDAYINEDVIMNHSEITNPTKKPVELQSYYSSSINIKAGKYLLTHFNGAWAREFQVEHELLTHGTKTISTTTGVRTTHNENPSFLLSLDTETFSERDGNVIAGALCWSGNYSLDFQMDETGRVSVLAGPNPDGGSYTLAKNSTLQTPDMAYTFSTRGAGQATRNLHDWARNWQLYDSSMMCPTLLNNWEGTYFKFNEEILKGIIDNVKAMGLEMFVLDDGWFGGTDYPRNSDNQGLGDWQIDPVKLPNGVQAVAEYAHSKGLKFGIWIEPEMVNPGSHLAQDHPDWIVGEKGRVNPLQRNQYILDLTNPKVQDFVFNVFDETMQLAPGIDYIKWDANRHVDNMGSAYLGKEQSNFWFDYTQGLYSVYRRLRAKYPNVLLQSCSSGGGRIDFGALHWCNEAWTSDNTEALTRVFIQYGTNMIYPSIILGSHVSAVPNHQTGNITPLKFRFDIASACRLGMEIQPNTMTDEEKAYATRAIESFKSFRDIVYYGDLYRLASPYDGEFYSILYVSKDKKRAVMFNYCIRYQSRTRKAQFVLDGLDPGMNYKVKELNVDRSCWWGNGKTFSGDFLCSFGINPDMGKIYDSNIFYFEAE